MSSIGEADVDVISARRPEPLELPAPRVCRTGGQCRSRHGDAQLSSMIPFLEPLPKGLHAGQPTRNAIHWQAHPRTMALLQRDTTVLLKQIALAEAVAGAFDCHTSPLNEERRTPITE